MESSLDADIEQLDILRAGRPSPAQRGCWTVEINRGESEMRKLGATRGVLGLMYQWTSESILWIGSRHRTGHAICSCSCGYGHHALVRTHSCGSCWPRSKCLRGRVATRLAIWYAAGRNVPTGVSIDLVAGGSDTSRAEQSAAANQAEAERDTEQGDAESTDFAPPCM